jgi:uncharacterized protein (TIGR03382 family)
VRIPVVYSTLAGAALMVVGAASLLHERSAQAYVCALVSMPKGAQPVTQAWNQRCIPYYINNGSALLSGNERRALISECFSTWSNNACTDLVFVDEGYTTEGAAFDNMHPYQNENVIKAVERPDDVDFSMLGSDGNLLALTLTSYSTMTGEIFDADIMINAVRFSFLDVNDERACLAMGAEPPYDLRNTLTHEMGHFIGFDHDPDAESTMFASAQRCETKKRDLTPQDLNGLCTVYPKGQPPHTCSPPSSGYDVGAGEGAFRNQCDLNRANECHCGAAGTKRGGGAPLASLIMLSGAMLLRRRG